jgi:SNF2 family DNA or RNA helicase
VLREEQIDLRRERAKAARFRIAKLDGKGYFGTYSVTNPVSRGQYKVTIRGFDVGDNRCSCPDYKSNTLGTCKHIEAVLAHIATEAPANVRKRKAAVIRPEITLDYGERLTLRLRLPPRHSDDLAAVARQFFDDQGLWRAGDHFAEFEDAARKAPEEIAIDPEAYDFIDRAVELHAMAEREHEWLAELEAGKKPDTLRDLLRIPLYDYQLRGAIFAACRGRAILGDDMGLGKTIQALAAAEILARLRNIQSVLVIAPASVKYQWADEIRRLTARTVLVIDGDQDERATLYGRPAFYRLINYEQATRDLERLNASPPDMVVLDEAQRIKNWEAKTSRAIKKLRSRYALVLTGTPLENKLEELYSIVQFVDDRRLGPAFQFLHDHRIEDKNGQLTGYRNLEAIRDRLAPIFLRRTRADVLTQLPARTDTVRYAELRPEQREPYDEQRRGLVRLLAKPFLTDLDRKRILSCLTNLRLICDSTFLFDKATHISPKLDEFADLVAEFTASADHKAVAFSQWETMLREAASLLDRLGVGYALLHGRIPGPERKELIERFRNEPGCRFFLSTDAGGTGLNLQHADTVIHLEPPWNPAIVEQRVGRVHRMGQERPVTVVSLVTRSSIEERIVQVMQQKRALFAGLFASDSDEIDFAALGQPAFVDSVRDIVGEEPAATSPDASLARAKLAASSVQFLEALGEVLATEPAPLAADLAARAKRALHAILGALDEGEPNES